jgi:aspartyl-tRNA(Asn)/glutamyl-tRNA(Gln) amidotransferase subunit B
MSEYIPTIGLEVHAELKTATKMFCNSKNDASEARPNVNICPVCMAHPGTLPVINREAVRSVLRVGVALDGTLADYTEFDRKNYFYPDLPKGYQLSQYAFPLVSGGTLNGIAITRIHLEEDTASSTHDEATGETLVDYNRAGVPLMELVTEPVIHSAKEAGDFGRELQLLLRYLGVSDADMEKGNMRLEANVSVSNSDTLGTKVEIKNINSFGIMERAVAYEIKRQIEALEKGESVIQETRGWDDHKQATFSQRTKEGSADYRYFPDPDLPSLKLSEVKEFNTEALMKGLPELPEARRSRYIAVGVKAVDASQFVSYPHLGAFLDRVIEGNEDPVFVQRAANYIANDLVNIIRDIEDRDAEIKHEISETLPISVENFRKIMTMIGEGRLSSRAAKDLLVHVVAEKGEPEAIAKERGLIQINVASDIEPIVEKVISEQSAVVADYRAGKEAALQFLIGQAMKVSKGSANPAQLKEIFLQKISN